MSVPSTATAADLQNLLRERLQAKIKTSFVELIPEELFDGMVDAATDEFLKGPRSKRFQQGHEWLRAEDPRNTTGKDGYCTFEKPIIDEKYNVYADTNTLPGMIYAELVARAREGLREALNADERFQQKWDPATQQMFLPIINQIVGDNAQAFMRALMGGILNSAMCNTINAIRSENQMPGGYMPPPITVPPGV